MLSSVVLDVAIGMAFVYLLLSLILSVVQEILAAFMQLRPANLQRGMRSLLSGDTIKTGTEASTTVDLVDGIYTHGLVRGLYSDPTRDSGKKLNLGLRVVDWSREVLRWIIGIKPEKPVAGVSRQMLLPAYIPSRTFALAMIDLLNPDDASGPDAMTSIRKLLKDQHVESPEKKAVEAMLTLATDAQGSLKMFQTNLENWYNDGMDRASGWYKRYTQTILLGVGLCAAILFNVDSIRVARVLWSDRDVRQGMVDAAAQYSREHSPAIVNPAAPGTAGVPVNPGVPVVPKVATTAVATLPAKVVPPVIAAQPPAPARGDDSVRPFSDSDLEVRLVSTVNTFKNVASTSLLPVGWSHSWAYNLSLLRHHPWDALWKALPLLPGWMITALAISLGAPFWFDTLNRFMVVRSTVKPQEKSKNEASKS